ncbi:claudin k isoform X1 [Brienomyrus brachyistius]|uniref:claudin k isoform X1 n=1 Tax=Brienomyrus brachyistius TaxID=42636 RepID=UPI0020B30D78|nr:claudin k isoform X1 [Brienomyrus brachyistius]
MASVEIDVTRRRRRRSMDAPLTMSAELRIVLFGSRSPLQFIVSNCILGRQVFMPAECILSQSLKNLGETDGRRVSVINTPNFFEKDRTQQHIKKELKRCVCLSCPGPHAVLLTLDLEDISASDVRTVEELTKYFGDNILKHTILLLCHEGKEENPNLEDRLRKDRNLSEIMDKCGHQYHLFNKDSMGAKPLLKSIESLAENGDRFFTNYKYEEIEGSIRKEQSVIEKERGKEMSKRLRELDCLYQGEELERKRDLHLKSVRAAVREKAEIVVLDRLGFAAQAMNYAAAVGKGIAVGVLGGAVLGLMVIVGGAIIGAVLGAVVGWKLWRR